MHFSLFTVIMKSTVEKVYKQVNKNHPITHSVSELMKINLRNCSFGQNNLNKNQQR